MASTYDAIVLGVGAMGSATCASLARRGARVLGLERFDVPHELGSSGGRTRLIRKAYFEHPDYVPLLHRAYELWEELESRAGEPLLFRTGLVCAGRPEGPLIAGTLRAATEHALRIDRVDAADVCPPLRVPESFVTLLDADGGFVRCERAVAAFARDAGRHGAEIRTGEHVVGWSADRDAVEVVTERERFRASRLVVTAGAWAPGLLTGFGVALRVTRQVIGWVAPPDPTSFALGAFPCWAVEDDVPGFEGIYYGFPIAPLDVADELNGVKVGHHHTGPSTDPDRVDRALAAADEADFRDGLRKFLPHADAPLGGYRVCLYTMSPDGHFVLDRHPAHDAVVVACGFSGHGFKFAPVIGEALADLALDGRTALPVGFLSLARFL